MEYDTFNQLVNVDDFDKMTLSQIENWQSQAEAYKLALDKRMRAASQAAVNKRRAMAPPPPVPPLPIEKWIEHPEDSRYEYVPGTMRVRFRGVPPLPRTPISENKSASDEISEKQTPSKNKSAKELSENKKTVLALVDNGQELTVKQAMIALKFESHESASHLLASMYHDDLLDKIGSRTYTKRSTAPNIVRVRAKSSVLHAVALIAENYKKGFSTKEYAHDVKIIDLSMARNRLSRATRLNILRRIGSDRYILRKPKTQFEFKEFEQLANPVDNVIEALIQIGRAARPEEISQLLSASPDAIRNAVRKAYAEHRIEKLSRNVYKVLPQQQKLALISNSQ